MKLTLDYVTIDLDEFLKGWVTVNIKDFYKLCKSGVTPMIKMRDSICDYEEDSFDPLMTGVVIDVSVAYNDSYRVLVDLKGFEEYNRSIALYNWRDNNKELTKCWLDTEYYPKDGLQSIYLPFDIEAPFEVISDNTLFADYLKSECSVGYVEWLESHVRMLE